MDNYKNSKSITYLAVILGTLVIFVPFAIVAVWGMKICSKIKGVLRNEKQTDKGFRKQLRTS